MPSFPAFIEVGHVPPLVVGASELAAAKARTLLLRAPRVTLAAVTSPATLPGTLAALIEAGTIEHLARAPLEDDIRGRPLVVSATGDPIEDARISALARGLGVPVNVPDKPKLCTFAFGAFIDRGDLTVAISTDGAAPILATHLRGWLERELHPRLGRVASIAREYRGQAAARVAFGAARREFWREVVTGAPAEAILAGDEVLGRRLIEAALEGVPAEAPPGRVVLVGAGPGDPELLTLKAVRALKSADVILHDALIDPRVLDHARREAHIVDVGKRARSFDPRGRSVSQREINAALIEHARAGKIVVRLKGGDPFVFGRAAEEVAAVEAAGIAVEIVPGITAAQACAADAHLPLTYRGQVRQVSLVTGAASDGEPDLDWEALARPGQAFAIHMGVRTAGRITAHLLATGADPSTRVVIVENGAREGRRVIATVLSDLPGAIDGNEVTGPAIAFVGLDWADAGLVPPEGVEWHARQSNSTPLSIPRPLSAFDRLALSPEVSP